MSQRKLAADQCYCIQKHIKLIRLTLFCAMSQSCTMQMVHSRKTLILLNKSFIIHTCITHKIYGSCFNYTITNCTELL